MEDRVPVPPGRPVDDVLSALFNYADAAWQPRPHWVATDQIVTVDSAERAIRHLATVVNVEKVHRVDDSLRLLLNL